MAIYRFRKRNNDTSSGFDAFGCPIPYDCASDAGVNPLTVPTEGLVFYASFKAQQDTAETGQPLDYRNDVTFTALEGIPCMYAAGADIAAETKAIEALTISFWGVPNEDEGYVYTENGNIDSNRGARAFGVERTFMQGVEQYVDYMVVAGEMDNSSMAHYLMTCENGSQNLYKNGELIASSSHRLSYDTKSGIYVSLKGYVAAVRVYDRILSDDEIQQLAKEFTV